MLACALRAQPCCRPCQANPSCYSQAFGYYVSGSESESTLRDNEESFKRYRLVPRLMVDVSKVDTTVQLLGERHAACLDIPAHVLGLLSHDVN